MSWAPHLVLDFKHSIELKDRCLNLHPALSTHHGCLLEPIAVNVHKVLVDNKTNSMLAPQWLHRVGARRLVTDAAAHHDPAAVATVVILTPAQRNLTHRAYIDASSADLL